MPAAKGKKAKLPARWFGEKLEEQESEMDRGRRVPKLALALRTEMEAEGALDEEGIFRQSPGAITLQFVKERLVSGEDPEEVCAGIEPHVLSGLFKDWLRALPGGLWAAASPQVRADLEEALLTDGGSGGAAPSAAPSTRASASAAAPKPHHVAMLLKQAMAPPQRDLLLWVLDFLAECAGHAAASKMGVEQLAVGAAGSNLRLPDCA